LRCLRLLRQLGRAAVAILTQSAYAGGSHEDRAIRQCCWDGINQLSAKQLIVLSAVVNRLEQAEAA
jgi:hypothetical protein